jgi:hypothetical protein
MVVTWCLGVLVCRQELLHTEAKGKLKIITIERCHMDSRLIKYWYAIKHWQDRHELSFRGIKQGVRNLRIWFPVIWKDRWWDHSFLCIMLRHKLILMEKGFRTRGVSTRSEEDAHNMKKCILLLDRVINDDYITYNKGDNIRKSFEEEQKMIDQDIDLLFKIIRKQLRAWWD